MKLIKIGQRNTVAVKEINGRIEVDSQVYNEDEMFHDVTLDTEYSNWINDTFKNILK